MSDFGDKKINTDNSFFSTHSRGHFITSLILFFIGASLIFLGIYYEFIVPTWWYGLWLIPVFIGAGFLLISLGFFLVFLFSKIPQSKT